MYVKKGRLRGLFAKWAQALSSPTTLDGLDEKVQTIIKNRPDGVSLQYCLSRLPVFVRFGNLGSAKYSHDMIDLQFLHDDKTEAHFKDMAICKVVLSQPLGPREWEDWYEAEQSRENARYRRKHLNNVSNAQAT